MSVQKPSRRRFLIGAATAVAAVPFAAHLLSTAAYAQDKPRLPLDNPQAKALNYVETTEGLQHPSYKPGSYCNNCQFWPAAADVEWGPCTLFPNHVVAGKGWCSAWARKA